MFVTGDGPVGVLVLAGSSGRVEEERCRVLAGLGATAASYRWFGETIDRVPLESFEEPLAMLHERCERLVVLGTSKGGEAALLAAEPDAIAPAGNDGARQGCAKGGIACLCDERCDPLAVGPPADVFAAMRDRGNRPIPAFPGLVRAVFHVKFRSAPRPRSVSIKPPNVALYDRDQDAGLVEEWLRRRGFQNVYGDLDQTTDPLLASA